MQKLTCILEFKDGRPVAKSVNELGNKPVQKEDEYSLPFCKRLKKWQTAENSRREFEIREINWIEDYKTYAWSDRSDYELKVVWLKIGDRFTATIENNIVTKIELL